MRAVFATVHPLLAEVAAGVDPAALAGARAGWGDWALGILVLGGVVPGLWVYGRLLWRTVAERGRVRAEGFGPTEAGIAAGLATVLVLLIATVGFKGAGVAPEPDGRAIVAGVLLDTAVKLCLVVGLILGLGWRGMNVGEFFGFYRFGAGRVLLTGAGLLAAALPVVYGVMFVTRQWTGPGHGEEEAVRLLNASRGVGPRLAMIVAATVVAPVVEEFLFRGYLYGVMRRYLGLGAGLVLNSALFAAIHLHVPSLGALFVLAVCLTLAYEATGSLLVPMAMHALFNALSVLAILLGTGGGG